MSITMAVPAFMLSVLVCRYASLQLRGRLFLQSRHAIFQRESLETIRASDASRRQ